jgi:hypothetical protein
VTYGKTAGDCRVNEEPKDERFAEGGADYGLFKVSASTDLKMQSALKQTGQAICHWWRANRKKFCGT